MKPSTLILNLLSLATSVASQMTAEKHIELFHEVWDPVTKGHFAVKNLNLDMLADDIIFRDPAGGASRTGWKGSLPRIPQERRPA